VHHVIGFRGQERKEFPVAVLSYATFLSRLFGKTLTAPLTPYTFGEI
jgi:hypothetical protein